MLEHVSDDDELAPVNSPDATSGSSATPPGTSKPARATATRPSGPATTPPEAAARTAIADMIERTGGTGQWTQIRSPDGT